ncbi:hypothetical protein QF037_001887 [Streptomyces canus]|nr:hypothetical protein [Streptomyces canus]
MFVFLGVDDGSHPPGVTLKLKDDEARAHALTCPGDWVEESYRVIAPKRLIAELDAQ